MDSAELELIRDLTWDGSSAPAHEWDVQLMNTLQVLVEKYVSNHQKVEVSQRFPLVDLLKLSREGHELRVAAQGISRNVLTRGPVLKDIALAMAPLDQNLSFESTNHSEVSKSVLNAIFSMIVPPESLRSTTWDDVIGNEETKRLVRREFELPFLQKDLMANTGKSRGILLYGPPGTGKTLMARALGNALYSISRGREHLVKFINTKTSALLGGLLGQTERNIAMLFEVAKTYLRTREGRYEKSSDTELLKQSICVLFLDEIDGLTPDRNDPNLKQYQRSSTNEVLIQSGGLTKGLGGDVFLFATSNYPHRVDPAMKRRLGLEVYFSLPSPRDRIQIMRLYLGRQESLKSAKIHEFLRGDLDKIAAMKKEYGKAAEALLDMNVHAVPRIGGLSSVKVDFPLIISRTAFFSSADLEVLAGDLVASGVEYGLAHWWRKRGKKWEVTEISTKDAPPTGSGGEYKNLLDLPPLSLKRHQPSKVAIEYTMRKMRAGVSFTELYPIEWYSLTGTYPELPIIVSEGAGPPKDADLWTLYAYHMNLFSDRYAQEVAMQMWRATMQFAGYEPESKSKRECIEELFSLSDKEAAWFTSIEEIRTALRASFDQTLVESVQKLVGRKTVDVPYDRLKERFKEIYRDYFDAWRFDLSDEEWKAE